MKLIGTDLYPLLQMLDFLGISILISPGNFYMVLIFIKFVIFLIMTEATEINSSVGTRGLLYIPSSVTQPSPTRI